jgi:hypothetical protein
VDVPKEGCKRRPTLVLDFIQQADDDLGFIDSMSVEIFSHSQSQLVFVYPPLRLRSRHCRRVSSDPIAKYDMREGVLKG